MIHPELEALLQGALDDTLTADERAQLARMLSENPEARARAAQLTALAGLIESLGLADAPAGLVDNVLAHVPHRPHVRHATFQRGVIVNKKILFGLAAAAAIVLAVITYNSNPPATVGTEATIGAAQRAQAPQIAPQDVKLGDTSSQDVLQTETFDAIMKDDALRTMLQDDELRATLRDAGFRDALKDASIRTALRDAALTKKLEDQSVKAAFKNAELVKKLNDDNMRVLLSNKAFAEALRRDGFRQVLMRPGAAAALAGPAMNKALLDRNFDAAVRSPGFAASLARGARASARVQ